MGLSSYHHHQRHSSQSLNLWKRLDTTNLHHEFQSDKLGQVSSNNTNKMAMSRALGAAFLNHQVEQLEKTVSSNGPASGNWRERKYNNNHHGPAHSAPSKRGPNSAGGNVAHRKKGSGESRDRMTLPSQEKPNRDRQVEEVSSFHAGRRNSEEDDRKGKDADVIVVDASVLLHALYKVKRWCRDGRQEVLIVPLEG